MRCPARSRRRFSPNGPRFCAIDADRIAREAGLVGRTNTVLQTCFFAISGMLPREEAIAKTYGRRGADVVARNHAAADAALEGLHQIEVPGRVTSARELPAVVPRTARVK
jgi:pyruvate-ferredoxin/flavodoxin oxidoreductase